MQRDTGQHIECINIGFTEFPLHLFSLDEQENETTTKRDEQLSNEMGSLVPASHVVSLRLCENRLTEVSAAISVFRHLVVLDLASNQISAIKTLDLRNNRLSDSSSLPKQFSRLNRSLRHLNLSGNNFIELPQQVTHLTEIRSLHFGGNQLASLPAEIIQLTSLEMLYLGGNRLKEVPRELGELKNLTLLNLCFNQLQIIPNSLTRLRNLKSLYLHNNELRTLPPELIRLSISELSLRNNPLVTRFCEDFVFGAATLKELAGRAVLDHELHYCQGCLPATLIDYLSTAHRCVNGKCKGVYFTMRVEHVKFVDFCGKYRVPLMQYLCSPNCRQQSPRVRLTDDAGTSFEDYRPAPGSYLEDNCAVARKAKMKTLLLG